MRKFRRLAEAALRFVKLREGRADHGVHDARIECAARAVKHFRFRDGLLERFGGFVHLLAARIESFGDRKQDAFETGAADGIFRRKIRAAVKRLAVRREKRGERPAALSGNGADGGLVARVHVGALVAVHLHRDVKLVDHGRDFRILVALAVNHVAPVAPDGADIEQQRLVRGARFFEGFLAPFVPVNGLVRGRAKVRARGIFQPIFGDAGHGRGLRAALIWQPGLDENARFLCAFRGAEECRLECDHVLHAKELEVILIGRVSIRNAVIGES